MMTYDSIQGRIWSELKAGISILTPAVNNDHDHRSRWMWCLRSNPPRKNKLLLWSEVGARKGLSGCFGFRGSGVLAKFWVKFMHAQLDTAKDMFMMKTAEARPHGDNGR